MKPKTRKRRTGGRLIAQGSFGCVNRPPIHCVDNNISYHGKISKIMERDNAEKELAEYKNIERVDPHRYFHMEVPTMCSPDLDSVEAQTLALCDVYSDSHEEFKLLLMSDGGQDLTNLDWDKVNVRAFLLELNRLFMGVALFVNVGYAHTDIKPNNIVYNVATNRINFIDFGLMQTRAVLGSNASSINNMWYHNPLDYAVVKNVDDRYVSTDEVLAHVAAQNRRVPVDSLIPEYENFESLIEANTEKRKQARHICLRTFDSYQLGLVVLFILTKMQHRLKTGAQDAIFRVGYGMCRVDPFQRMDIQAAARAYEDVLNQFVLVGAPSHALLEVIDHLAEIPTASNDTSIYSNIPSPTLHIPKTWSRSRSRSKPQSKSRSPSLPPGMYRSDDNW